MNLAACSAAMNYMFSTSVTNKTTAFIIVALLLCVSSVAQEKITSQREYRYLAERIDGVYIPKDIDEAIDSLDMLISVEDKRYVTDSLSLEDFRVACHHSLGMWIRNNWGLWGGSRLQRYLVDRHVIHPDDMSDNILKAYYKKKIQGLDYAVEDDIEASTPSSRDYKVIKNPLKRLWLRLKYKMSENYRETKREFKEKDYKKGKTVYFMYPYGCSTEEEEEIWFEDDNLHHLAKGKITDIDYVSERIKVKLIDTISPYGIIIFDGDIEQSGLGDIQRDFDTFVVNSPNRFYMQKGDELWFDIKPKFWDTGRQLEQK